MTQKVTRTTRNAKIFLIYRVVSRLYFYLPVLVIYFIGHDQSFLNIGLLLCAYSLMIMVFEKSSNKLVEKSSAKFSIIFGEIIKACGLALLVYGSDFSQFFIAQILIGLGYSIAASGDSSLISRSLINGENHNQVQKTAHILVLVCVVGASIIGSIVAQFYGAESAILISLPPPLLAVLVACFFIEPVKSTVGSSPTVRRSGYFWRARSSGLLVSILNYGVSRAIFMSMFVAFIPVAYLILFKVPLSVFGLVIGSYTVVSILTASYSSVVCRLLGERLTMTVSYAFLVMAGVFLVFQGPLPQLLYLSPVLMGFAAGMTRPLAVAQFSRQVDMQDRGRALTLAESVNAVFTVLLTLAICEVMDVYGIENGLIVLSASIAILASLALACIYLFPWYVDTRKTVPN